MSTLSIPNSFVASTTILSAQVNANFSAIAAWANGNIGSDNIGTLTGALAFTVASNALCLSGTNSGNQGIASFSQTGVLDSSRSILKLTSSAAQTTGDAGIDVQFTNASSTIPLVRLTNDGSGNFITCRTSAAATKFSVSSAGNTTVAGTLAVTGASTLTGAATLSSTLAVTGAVTLSDTLGVTGNSQLDGTVRIGGSSGATLSKQTVNSVDVLRVSLPIQLASGSGFFSRMGSTNDGINIVNASSGNPATIVTSAVPSSRPLMIVRGDVSSAGSATRGEGFSVSRTAVGSYTITFSTNFAEAPSVVATCTDSGPGVAISMIAYSAAVGSVLVRAYNGPTLTDVSFAFSAKGQRGV
jgi:fibronectin-binding autotransporter adhesin